MKLQISTANAIQFARATIIAAPMLSLAILLGGCETVPSPQEVLGGEPDYVFKGDVVEVHGDLGPADWVFDIDSPGGFQQIELDVESSQFTEL